MYSQGTNEVKYISTSKYKYTNSIGEIFFLEKDTARDKKGNIEVFKLIGEAYYGINNINYPKIFREDGRGFLRANHLRFSLLKRNDKYYMENIGMFGDYTDLCKNKGSFLLVCDLWFKKNGYPKLE